MLQPMDGLSGGEIGTVTSCSNGAVAFHEEELFLKKEFLHSAIPFAAQPKIGLLSSHQQNSPIAIPILGQQHSPFKQENPPRRLHWLPSSSAFSPQSDLISSPESLESNDSSKSKPKPRVEHFSAGSSELERSGRLTLLADWELMRLNVRELNQKLAGQDRSVVSALKQKRRTLKNRGYALNCRARRLKNMQQLEKENTELRGIVQRQAALLVNYERKLGICGTSDGQEMGKTNVGEDEEGNEDSDGAGKKGDGGAELEGNSATRPMDPACQVYNNPTPPNCALTAHFLYPSPAGLNYEQIESRICPAYSNSFGECHNHHHFWAADNNHHQQQQFQ